MASSSIAARTLNPSSPPSLLACISSVLETLPTQNNSNQKPTSPSPLDPFASHLTPTLLLAVLRSHTNRPHSALTFLHWAFPLLAGPTAHSCFATASALLLSHRHLSAAASLLPLAPTPASADLLSARLIAAHGDVGDLRGAIHHFHRCPHGLYALNAALRVLVRSNRARLARAVFDQAVESGRVRPDVSSFTTLIRGYAKLGQISAAERVFTAMTAVCRPNLITYNTLIDGYCRKGLLDRALQVVDSMVQSRDCSPDTVTFTTLINGYFRAGDLAGARRCMDEMVHRWKLEPNILTYNSMINGLCLAGRVEEATALMSRMRLDGIRADVTTHTCVLKGLCVAGRPRCAAEHLAAMGRAGVEPDAKAYGVVLNEWCKMGRVEDAIGVLEEMRERGITPKVSSLNAVLRALSEAGEVERAVGMLERGMAAMGCSPNFVSYSTVIGKLCRCRGRMGTVEELVVGMVRNGHRPDATMYGAMVEGYCRDGELGMALGVMRDMMGNGFVISEGGFEVLVQGLCGSGRGGEARKVFEEMRTRFLGVAKYIESYERILNKLSC